MRVGDVIELSVWITGDEPQELIDFYKKDVIEAVNENCNYHNVVHGEVTFHLKHPMDDRVPEVPDHIQGSEVRLLVAETKIMYKKYGKLPFSKELDKDDLKRLRKVTRKQWAKQYKSILSDEQADDVIDELGEDVALGLLRQ